MLFNTYQSSDGTKGYVLLVSKMYPEGDKEKYWFGYRENRFERIEECSEQYCVMICRNRTTLIFSFPREFLEAHKPHFNNSVNDEGSIKHYHIVLHRETDGKVALLLSKPTLKKIDVTEYLVAEI